MDRDLLGHLPIIACVARHRSFAAAAAELGMSPSAISHAVRSVEDRLAIPLFARTTQTSVDIVAQGFDAGIRMLRSIQQDMVTTRLTGSFKFILVASRGYLDARGTPKSIADLHQHNCIHSLVRETRGIRNVASGEVFDWE